MFSFFSRKSTAVEPDTQTEVEVAAERDYVAGSITVKDQGLVTRLRFHGLSEEDLGVIATWRETCERVTDDLVDQFYAHIASRRETQDILERHTTVERQRPRLTRYVLTMFSGCIDEAYVQYRQHVGRLHDNIDLDSNWYVAMYEIIRRVLEDAVRDEGATDQEFRRFQQALQRLIQVDIALVTTALTDSRMGKLDRLKQEQSETMRGLVADLVDTARKGHLNVRLKPDEYQGDVREFVVAMNSMLDAIVTPVQEASRVLGQIAERDLTPRVDGEYEGDHAIIKTAVNSAAEDLQQSLLQVRRTVEEVLAGATQVSDASQALSAGATEQASNLEEINATIEQITTQTQFNADNARQANLLAQETSTRAGDGNQRMDSMLEAMHDIRSASEQISKIIKVIDEIAFQTNLLALNAAVEAARAGVHGKGFAVVAEEVRNLATRSAKAAKETTELIEASVRKVENGHSLAQDTAGMLGEIVTSITRMTDLVGEIANASKEQAQGIQQVNSGLSQVGQVTQGNAANAEQTAAASEQLSSQANELNYMVNRFQLGDSYHRHGQAERSEQNRRRPAAQRQLPGNGGGTLTPSQEIDLDSEEFDTF